MSASTYFDYNGSTPVDPEVARTYLEALQDGFGNPSASHPQGALARATVDRARESIGAALGARADDIFITSGGTESNNWALLGLATEAASSERGHLIVSSIEHKSVLRPAQELARRGVDVTFLPVTPEGAVRLEDLAAALRPDTFLVSVMLANNETGVLQPAAEIAALCRERGVPYHCDAVCVIGKLPVDLRLLDCDLLSLSGHKLYAPKGFGILYRRPGLALRPRILGCGQQGDLRSGTEDAAGAAAFARSLERMAEGAYRAAAAPGLRDELWQALQRRFPGARLNGGGARLPNTLSVAFPGARASVLQAELARRGFSVGVGASGGRGTASHVLVAMGLAELATSTLRFTLGASSRSADLPPLLEALEDCLAAAPTVSEPR